MLRQFLMSAVLIGSIAPSVPAIAEVATSSTTSSCVKTSDRRNAKGKYRYTCVQFDEQGKVVATWVEWRDAYSVPRSDRPSRAPGNDGKVALKPCKTNNPRKEGRCIIKTLAPVAVQDPTSDGKNDPVYPGLPPAPKYSV